MIHMSCFLKEGSQKLPQSPSLISRINWSLVTWSHMDVGKARKCNLLFGHVHTQRNISGSLCTDDGEQKIMQNSNHWSEAVRAESQRRQSGKHLIPSQGVSWRTSKERRHFCSVFKECSNIKQMPHQNEQSTSLNNHHFAFI